ncbi:MAG: HAD family hydrolase [Phycisphaerae bacterium]|nr:HAD family hydrolase [Phycisphaerae bacterium]
MALKAMLFDMDGTLTRPRLDFAAIKREIGIPTTSFILEVMETMTPTERERAMAIVERHEQEAAERSELNDGVVPLLAELGRRGILTGIITRNSRRSCETVMTRHELAFSVLVCRECARAKPSPDGILLALQRLRIDAASAVYVGDHLIDLQAGHAAGARTILVTNGHDKGFHVEADFVVAGPGEIVGLLDTLQGTAR